MDILYTTSSAQSARELSLRRYSSVTMHLCTVIWRHTPARLVCATCAMPLMVPATAKLNTPYYAVRMFLVTVDCVRESGCMRSYTEAIKP